MNYFLKSTIDEFDLFNILYMCEKFDLLKGIAIILDFKKCPYLTVNILLEAIDIIEKLFFYDKVDRNY